MNGVLGGLKEDQKSEPQHSITPLRLESHMFWVHFFYAVFFAALLSIFFYAVFRSRGPWSSLLLLFLILFLASWAGGVWLSPMGPGFRGTYWVPFLVSGLIIALLIAAMAPSRREESTVELVDTRSEQREKRKVYKALSVFFWIIVAALAVAIAGHYLTRHHP